MTAVTNKLRITPRVSAGAQALPLLDFLAGEHAHAIAYLWPKPHTEFYALPAARRHVAGMVVAGATAEIWSGDRKISVQIERAKDGDLARLIAGDTVPGLMKALAKCGEQLWTARDYLQFVELFQTLNGARFLRHAKDIRPSLFGPAAALPDELRVPKIAGALTTVTAAQNLAEAYTIIAARGDGAGVAQRWGRAKDRRALFIMASQDLTPSVFKPMTLPPDLPAPFEPVTTRKELNALALEFENCLRDYTIDIAAGRMAVFAWRGEPKAAVAIRQDAAGWRLAEAQGQANDDLPEATLKEIASELGKVGVRMGRALSVLAGWLERYGNGHENEEARFDECYDTLYLGDLWN